MPEQSSVQERLGAIEHAVRQLQNRLDRLQGRPNWLHRFCGEFDEIPEAEFQEFVRVGGEFQSAYRPETSLTRKEVSHVRDNHQ